jgi:hypothetical protein
MHTSRLSRLIESCIDCVQKLPNLQINCLLVLHVHTYIFETTIFIMVIVFALEVNYLHSFISFKPHTFAPFSTHYKFMVYFSLF